MNINFNITLDELIDFVLTDAYLTYTADDIDRLGWVMNEKLKNIIDPDEKEFYSGVVESLILEMNETAGMSKLSCANPVKKKYDAIGSKLSFDVNCSVEQGKAPINYSHAVFATDYIKKNHWSCAFYNLDVSLMICGMASLTRPINEIIPGFDKFNLDSDSGASVSLDTTKLFQKVN